MYKSGSCSDHPSPLMLLEVGIEQTSCIQMLIKSGLSGKHVGNCPSPYCMEQCAAAIECYQDQSAPLCDPSTVMIPPT